MDGRERHREPWKNRQVDTPFSARFIDDDDEAGQKMGEKLLKNTIDTVSIYIYIRLEWRRRRGLFDLKKTTDDSIIGTLS